MSKNIYHFFVEGEGERAIINTLKTDFQCNEKYNKYFANRTKIF